MLKKSIKFEDDEDEDENEDENENEDEDARDLDQKIKCGQVFNFKL